MPRKKIEVVELNKKEEKIVLEEKQSPLLSFWRNNYFLLLITALILSLTILSIGIIVTIKNIQVNEKQVIKNVSIDTTLDDYVAGIRLDDSAITEETAKDRFISNSLFGGRGEVILTKIIDNDDYTIKYYSDGTATKYMKAFDTFTRIKPLPNGNYGIKDNGMIDVRAITSTITVTNTRDYPWGKVTYYSDGSAEVTNNEINVYVRDSKDIKDNYISDNKVAYLKDTKKVNNITLNYYYDGTIEVIKDNRKYLVRDESDLSILENDVLFKNDNAASIYKTVKTSDGMVIEYYQDGGAIIRDGDKSISIRKSNSIVIKNNKVYEIVDNTYVEISNVRDDVTYYTNGGAVIEKDKNHKYYVDENSDIKYKNDQMVVPNNKEDLSDETTVNGENVKVFEQTAVITTDDYINIIPKEKVVYDENGNIKEIEANFVNDTKEFKIINNTNDKIKYRVVLEKSSRTNLDTQYIRYQLQANQNYVGPSKLRLWEKDKIYEALKLNTVNYILLDGVLEPLETESISMMLWTDYDTIPNSMQNKYFYGTIKVYAWSYTE